MEAKLRVLKRKLDSRDTDIPEEGDLAFKRTRTAAVKQRVLVFSARGVTSRFRHLMEDVRKLLPHHKKDAKLDLKKDFFEINEIADVKSCTSCLFFEARKRQDLYLWMSITPRGPSVKFLVSNVHTMDELRMTGNCLQGSRPVLHFDKAFDTVPHLQLLREMFTQIWQTPAGHPKSKPFVDHVLSLHVLDGRIWFRNYQDDKSERRLERKGEETHKLVEVGPRFVLTPIRIFSGSFGGPTLYQNPEYVSPNLARRMHREELGNKYRMRIESASRRKAKMAGMSLPSDGLESVFR